MNEKDIAKQMKALGISRDEAIKLLMEDEEVDRMSMKELNATLTAEQKKVAEEVGGLVCHNVRISHKQLKKRDDIAEECHSWAFGTPLDDILWYLQEHRDEMDEWAEHFKKSFCEMVDTIKKELQEDE